MPAQGTLPDGNPYGDGTVSCVGPSFCMAIDGAGGGHTFNGSKWRAIADPATGLSYDRNVSCVRPTWCMVDVFGRTTIWDGAHWSTPDDHVLRLAGIHAIDCPTESFCVGVDGESPGHVRPGRDSLLARAKPAGLLGSGAGLRAGLSDRRLLRE